MKNKYKKNNKIAEIHLNYLFNLSTKTAYQSINKAKFKMFINYTKNLQYPLQRLKRIICKKCEIFLIPKVNCTTEFVKREHGFCFETKCDGCQSLYFIVQQNRSRLKKNTIFYN